jgi:hypothetical protein
MSAHVIARVESLAAKDGFQPRPHVEPIFRTNALLEVIDESDVSDSGDESVQEKEDAADPIEQDV